MDRPTSLPTPAFKEGDHIIAAMKDGKVAFEKK